MKQWKQWKLYDQRFNKIKKLGEGTYGKVYKVSITSPDSTGEKETIYALKKFDRSLFAEGMDITALREISILREIDHENIVKIYDMFYGISTLFIAYEYIDCELSHMIHIKTQVWSEGDIKNWLYQWLKGLQEIHGRGVWHRDIKPQNLLVDKNGILKLVDFGFARFIATPGKEMSIGVISDWYRPPEIFFGAKHYSFSVDVWSTGCIFAEMLWHEPIFNAESEIDILTKIFLLLGVPNDSIWPDANQWDAYKWFDQGDVITIRKKFVNLDSNGVDLLERMLKINPNQRITVEEAWKHPYFTTGVKMSDNDKIKEYVKWVNEEFKEHK